MGVYVDGVMKDPRIAGMEGKEMLFNAKRIFWGGFKELVAL